MDGLLEQILSELKEIKQLLAKNQGIDAATKSDSINDTMKSKEAAEYLGITEYRLRTLTKQGEIKHFMAGNRFLYKRESLELWLVEIQEASIRKNEVVQDYGKIRRVKE
ncbi:MAG: helix-turn-helix domain-containing protein [Clostridiaceae bacterium]|nr:helix-turn-helix domain-containing protein [Clostridiaceae bacterium]